MDLQVDYGLLIREINVKETQRRKARMSLGICFLRPKNMEFLEEHIAHLEREKWLLKTDLICVWTYCVLPVSLWMEY